MKKVFLLFLSFCFLNQFIISSESKKDTLDELQEIGIYPAIGGIIHEYTRFTPEEDKAFNDQLSKLIDELNYPILKKNLTVSGYTLTPQIQNRIFEYALKIGDLELLGLLIKKSQGFIKRPDVMKIAWEDYQRQLEKNPRAQNLVNESYYEIFKLLLKSGANYNYIKAINFNTQNPLIKELFEDWQRYDTKSMRAIYPSFEEFRRQVKKSQQGSWRDWIYPS